MAASGSVTYVAKDILPAAGWLVSCGLAAVLIGGSVPFPASAQQSEQGAQARAVQADLQALGHNPGGVDGRWGRQSVQALLRFQRAEGLPPTGHADLPTVTRLRERRQAATGVAPYALKKSTVNAPSTGSPVTLLPTLAFPAVEVGTRPAPTVGDGPGEAVSSTRPEGGRVASSDQPLPSPPGIVPPGIPATGEVSALDRPHHAPTAVATDTGKPAFWDPGRLHVAPAIVAAALAAVAVLALWALRRRSRPGTHLPATSAGISNDAPPRLPDVDEPPVLICEAAAVPPQPDRQAGPPQDTAASPAVQNVEGAPRHRRSLLRRRGRRSRW